MYRHIKVLKRNKQRFINNQTSYLIDQLDSVNVNCARSSGTSVLNGKSIGLKVGREVEDRKLV